MRFMASKRLQFKYILIINQLISHLLVLILISLTCSLFLCSLSLSIPIVQREAEVP